MTKIKLLLGFLLLLLPMPAAALTTCFKPSTNTTWCTDNEKLAQEYSAYVYHLRENNASFYERYTRDSYYVQKEAVYPLVFENAFFIDKIMVKYSKVIQSLIDAGDTHFNSELSKMVFSIGMYSNSLTEYPFGQELLFTTPKTTSEILKEGKATCVRIAILEVSFLRALGIPSKIYVTSYSPFYSDAQVTWWNNGFKKSDVYGRSTELLEAL